MESTQSAEAFVIEPCQCNGCRDPTDKKKEEMTKEENILDFLFDDIQRQIRLLKISLASAENSYLMIEKLIKNK